MELPIGNATFLLENIMEEDAFTLETLTTRDRVSATLHCLDSVPANLIGTTQILIQTN